MKLLQITWYDANSPQVEQWVSIHEVEATLVRVDSTGWLVAEADDALTLAGSVTEAEMCGSLITIPRSCVKSMRSLGDWRPAEPLPENVLPWLKVAG